ncbi:MAG: hypothetical protein HKL87_09430 [Acidimicrobiaceae bacterium]|nr:hypothetical protein [Acidimicrobiaceae bacterium]
MIPRVRQSRTIVRVGLVVMVVVLVIWGLLGRHHSAAGTSLTTPTLTQLLRDEGQLNADYERGDARATWSFFDPSTRHALSFSRYVADRKACLAPATSSSVLGATGPARGWWTVTYRMSGVNLIDYWHVVNHRWAFSLLRSNPRDVVLYQLTPGAYVRAVGCAR